MSLEDFKDGNYDGLEIEPPILHGEMLDSYIPCPICDERVEGEKFSDSIDAMIRHYTEHQEDWLADDYVGANELIEVGGIEAYAVFYRFSQETSDGYFIENTLHHIIMASVKVDNQHVLGSFRRMNTDIPVDMMITLLPKWAEESREDGVFFILDIPDAVIEENQGMIESLGDEYDGLELANVY